MYRLYVEALRQCKHLRATGLAARQPVGVCSKNVQELPSTAASSAACRCFAATSPAYAKENALTCAVDMIYSQAKPVAFTAGCVASWGTSTATCRCPTSAHTMLAAAKPSSPCRNCAVDTAAEPLPLEGLAGCAAAQASHRSLPVLLACKSSNQWEWRRDTSHR